MADTTFGMLFNDNINTCKDVTCDPELVLAEAEPSAIPAPMGKLHMKISVGLLSRIIKSRCDLKYHKLESDKAMYSLIKLWSSV